MRSRGEIMEGRAIVLVARATWVEATRRKLWWLVALGAVAVMVGGVGLDEMHFGSARLRWVIDLGFGGMGLGATILAVVGTVQLFFGELDSKWWQFVLARPVSREAWLMGKLVGVLGVVGAYCGTLAIALGVTVGWVAGGSGLMELAPEVVSGTILLWFRAAIVSAGTMLICTSARSALFATSASLLAVVVGHLRPAAELWPRDGSIGGVVGWIVRLWPDLQLFEPTGNAAWSPGLWGYAAGHVILCAGVAALVFRKREL